MHQIKQSGLDKIDFDEIAKVGKDGAEGKIVDVVDEESQTIVEVYVE